MEANRIAPSVRNVRSRPDPMSRLAVLRRPSGAADAKPGQRSALPTAASPASTPATPASAGSIGRHHRAERGSTDDIDKMMDGEGIDVSADLDGELDRTAGSIIGLAVQHPETAWTAAEVSSRSADAAAQPDSPGRFLLEQLDGVLHRTSDLPGTLGGWVPERRRRPIDDFDLGPAGGSQVLDTTTSKSTALVSTGLAESDDERDELPAMPVDVPMLESPPGVDRHTRPPRVGTERRIQNLVDSDEDGDDGWNR